MDLTGAMPQYVINFDSNVFTISALNNIGIEITCVTPFIFKRDFKSEMVSFIGIKDEYGNDFTCHYNQIVSINGSELNHGDFVADTDVFVSSSPYGYPGNISVTWGASTTTYTDTRFANRTISFIVVGGVVEQTLFSKTFSSTTLTVTNAIPQGTVVTVVFQ